MSKVFRLGQGANTHTDWNRCNFPYDSNNRKNIEDPDGATVRKEITSIPSPFARIDLVKNAFREVVESRDIDGNTIHHKMVSDSLDIGEIFFNYDRFQDRVEIITWNPKESISELMESGLDGCKYLGDALSKYLEADKAAYNFDKMQNIYILNYKKGKKELDIIGATSPKTLFFSNANDLSYLSEDLSFESDKPFDSELNPLYKRDHEYIKAWYIFRKNYPGFAEDFAELEDYWNLTFENLPNELRQELRNMDSDNLDNLDSIKISQSGQSDIVEVLGHELYKLSGTVSIDASDFLIDSKICDEQILVLPIDKGNTYKDLIYISEKWGDKKAAEPYDYRPISERTLPSRGDKQPYLTISDFLEPQIIHVPYLLNEADYYTAHKRENGEEGTFLLPLKPLFFKYFTTEDIINENLISIKRYSKVSAEVTLRIPIRSRKQCKYIEYKRTYFPDTNSDEEHNKGAVTDLRISGYVMPNIRFIRPEEAIYKVGLVMKNSSKYRLECFQNDQLIKDFSPVTRQGQNDIAKCSSFTISKTNFDYLRLTGNGSAAGVIIPIFKKQNINNEFKFAVDLGTSNTHIEVSKNGKPSTSYEYAKAPVSKFFVQTFDEHGGPKNLQVENNLIDKDTLPPTVGNGSDIKFPTRTILSCSKNIDWTSNLKSFELHSIPLTYGKRVEAAYNDYFYDIKWGTEDRDKAMLKCYIEDLLFMLRTMVAVEGGDLAKTKLTWFYPISMAGSRRGKLVKIWNEKFSEFFPGSPNNPEPMSESYAPVLYYREEDTSVSNLVNIDIGGGTTDVAYFVDKDLSFVTSFKFAANDIFQNAFVKNSTHNAIVDAYKDSIKSVLEQNQGDVSVKEILQIFDSDNNRYPANMASFLFSLCDNQNLKNVNRNMIDFNELLQEDEQFKIVFVVFYTSIIYHIAQIIKLKQLPLPRHISLSGNGSKVVKIVSNDEYILSKYTKKIFEKVVGVEYGESQLDIIGLDKVNSKESTCKGGILGSEPKGNQEKQVILKSTGTEFVKDVQFKDVDGEYRKTVEESAKNFFKFFFELCSEFNMKDDFGVKNTSIDIIKRICLQDLETFIKRGLEQQKEDYEESDPLRETLFFYPLKGFLNNLINNLKD